MKSLVIGKVYSHEIIIPKEALIASEELAKHLANLIGLDEFESSLAAYWSLEVRKIQWSAVLGLLKTTNAKGLRYLEIGCGLGLFTIVGQLSGFNCIGVEPGEEQYGGSVEIAQQVLQANGLPMHLIQRGHGERLEFSNDSFDVVCSFQTIEHVDNPALMLSEIRRVLKPGGLLFLQCPNYLYPYEGHYGLLLPCFMGKKITKFCLQFYRRPTQFLAHLKFVTPNILRKWLHAAGFKTVKLFPTLNFNNKLELPIEVYPLPFKFTRGVSATRVLSRCLNLPLLRNIAQHLEVYPQITCIAWENI